MKKILMLSCVILAFAILCIGTFEVAAASTTPASEYGEGLCFAEHTGRYMLTKDFSEMPLTFEATVYFPTGATYPYSNVIISNDKRMATGFTLGVTRTGYLQIMFYDTAQETSELRYTFSKVYLYNGEKTHIAVVCDTENSLIHCYVNGTLTESLEATVNPKDFSSKHVNLGTGHLEANVHYFKGALINLACYSDMRTAEEIKADVTSYGSDDLMLHYDLTNATYGKDVTDLSGNGINAIYEQYWYDSIENITDYAYSIAVVGDTQHNVEFQPENFAKLYDWIKANANSKKMAFMLGVGDITNNNTDTEWAYALENFAKLDGVIPYALARGNHDGNETYTEKLVGTEYEKAIGNNYYSNYANSYQYFKAGDINYLIITLNYNPANSVIAWAKKIAQRNPYHRVIVVTHANTDPVGDFNGNGETMWEDFVKDCPNVEMVLSGHSINDKIVKKVRTGTQGNLVNYFLINGQGVDLTRYYEGQDVAGLVAMLYFDETGHDLTVEYYSTTLDKYFMECNQFSTTIGHVSGDVNYDGEVKIDDALKMIKALLNKTVCYNGDMNNDTQFDFDDILCMLNELSK